MLVFDSTLVGDYLDGTAEARAFLERHEHEAWAVPSLVLYEALMGCVHGYVGGSPPTVRQAITASMDVLPVTERTAREAASLQDELLARGVPADHPRALVAATAREHGGTFATADRDFWSDSVRAVVPVAEYDPAKA